MLGSIHPQRILFLMIQAFITFQSGQAIGRLPNVAQEVADTRGFFTECNSLYTGFSGTAGDAQFGFFWPRAWEKSLFGWFLKGVTLCYTNIAIKNGDL